MPRLPQIISTQRPVSRTGVPRLPLRTFTATERAVEAAGQELQDVSLQMLERETQLRRYTQTGEIMNEATKKLQDFIATQEADPDFETHRDRVFAGLKTLTQKTLDKAPDRFVRAAVQRSLQGLTLQTRAKAISFQRKKEIGKATAVLDERIDLLIDQAISASGQQLDYFLGELEGELAGGVALGAITEEQRTARRKEALVPMSDYRS